MDTLPFVLAAVSCSIVLIAPLVGIGLWTRYKSSLKEVEKNRLFSNNLSGRTLDVNRIKRFFIIVTVSIVPLVLLLALPVLVGFIQPAFEIYGESTILIFLTIESLIVLLWMVLIILVFIRIMYKK